MQLHQVKPNTELKRERARMGRGGKRGTSAGRGTKGQGAHAGRRIKPAAYDLLMRLPKLRGFNNKSIKPKTVIVKLADLEKVKGEAVNRETLVKAGVLRNNLLRKKWGQTIKILGKGEAKKKYKIDGLLVSNSVKEAIVKAGGSVN